VHGLVALMEIQASRTHARTNFAGEPILLADQDRTRWDHALIRHGLAELQRAERLNGARSPYAMQAAIAACHARAGSSAQTDWPRIASLYATLAQLTPSPIIELNRAVAVSMAFGPQAGLDIVDTLTSDPALKSYHLLPAVRADLLKKLGRLSEAQAEFARAASLAQNSRERTLLLSRAASCAGGAGNRDERKQKRDLWKQAAHPQCLSAPMRRPLVAHSFFVPHVVDLRRLFPHTGDVRSAVTATSARASRHFPPHAAPQSDLFDATTFSCRPQHREKLIADRRS